MGRGEMTEFDALVMVPNCDKIVPGVIMAAARMMSVSLVYFIVL